MTPPDHVPVENHWAEVAPLLPPLPLARRVAPFSFVAPKKAVTDAALSAASVSGFV